MFEDLLNQGIQAAQSGNLTLARKLLAQAVIKNPNSARAWYWFGEVIEDPQKKKYCYDRALFLKQTRAGEPVINNPIDQRRIETTALPGAKNEPQNMAPEIHRSKAEVGKQSPGTGKIPAPILIAVSGGGFLLLVVCLIVFLVYAMKQEKINEPVVSIQANSLPTTKTRPVMPTLIPSNTPSPIITRTSTPVPSPTPTLNPTDLYQHLGFQITAARIALDTDRSSDCIRSYDRLLLEMPNWATGYYNRGVCKRQASSETHYLDEYHDYQIRAIEDQDQAISLDPNYSNAYVERAFDYINLVEILDNTAEENLVLEIAYENLRAALALGTTHSSAQINRVLIPIRLNRCQEGLQEGYRQLDTTSSGEPEALLYEILAVGHLCLGEYSKALPYIEKSIEMESREEKTRFHTAILIGLGNQDGAFQVIDQGIQRKSDFTGYRYYLRALIYYERGEFDLARQDLDIGYGNTWYHGGLYAYLMGVLALHDDNQIEGIDWLKYAMDSVQPDEGLWVKKRIQDELLRLGVQYTMPTPAIHWDITPIPTLPNTPASQ